jgi:hypothetical protein
MSRRLTRWRAEREADRATVVLCRGGDCGSRKKHPAFDHVGQLRTVRARVESDRTAVAVSKCLDACEHSNVVVVVPGRREAEAGIQPLWIGEVLDERATEDLADWVADGDLRAEPPASVQDRRFEPTTRSRMELGAAGRIRGRRAR